MSSTPQPIRRTRTRVVVVVVVVVLTVLLTAALSLTVLSIVRLLGYAGDVDGQHSGPLQRDYRLLPITLAGASATRVQHFELGRGGEYAIILQLLRGKLPAGTNVSVTISDKKADLPVKSHSAIIDFVGSSRDLWVLSTGGFERSLWSTALSDVRLTQGTLYAIEVRVDRPLTPDRGPHHDDVLGIAVRIVPWHSINPAWP